ncbi:MAG: hypothetical protein NTV34_03920 [Proteobacteria bacterium]|nr:hypothetical protein [Pseudomonadota bacterium]
MNDDQPWAHTAATLWHFMQDQLDDKNYRGFPVLGMNYGVVKSPLKPDDVLTGIDQHQLDNRGFYRHPVWGAISAKHYISQRYGSEKVTLRYLRAGKPIQAIRPLRRYNGQDNRLPGLTFEGDIAHLIIGGLVFRELGVDFLSTFGRDWARYAPANLLHLFHFKNYPMLSRRRYLILSQVLADSFNQGYDKEGGLILEKVNGDFVANLDELRLTALARPVNHLGEKFFVFEFEQGIKIVLPYDGLKEAQARIAKAYGIASPKSFLN